MSTKQKFTFALQKYADMDNDYEIKTTIMQMQVLSIVKQMGYVPIEQSIRKSIGSLRNAQYTNSEIKETLMDCYGVDEKLIAFIKNLNL